MSTKKTTKTAPKKTATKPVTKKAAPKKVAPKAVQKKVAPAQTIPVVETPVVAEITKVKAVPVKKEHIAIRQEVYNLVTSVAGPRKGLTIGAFVEGLINKHFEGVNAAAETSKAVAE